MGVFLQRALMREARGDMDMAGRATMQRAARVHKLYTASRHLAGHARPVNKLPQCPLAAGGHPFADLSPPEPDRRHSSSVLPPESEQCNYTVGTVAEGGDGAVVSCIVLFVLSAVAASLPLPPCHNHFSGPLRRAPVPSGAPARDHACLSHGRHHGKRKNGFRKKLQTAVKTATSSSEMCVTKQTARLLIDANPKSEG